MTSEKIPNEIKCEFIFKFINFLQKFQNFEMHIKMIKIQKCIESNYLLNIATN